MKVTLDLFTRKSKVYYVGLVITLVTFIFIAIASINNLQSKSPFMPLYDTILIICSLISCAFVVIVGMGLIGTYLKDGELVLGGNSLVIDNLEVPLQDINYINLKLSPRNVKSHVLDGNRIAVGDIKGKEIKRRFAISSYNQNKEFEAILDSWRAEGVNIYEYLRVNGSFIPKLFIYLFKYVHLFINGLSYLTS